MTNERIAELRGRVKELDKRGPNATAWVFNTGVVSELLDEVERLQRTVMNADEVIRDIAQMAKGPVPPPQMARTLKRVAAYLKEQQP